MFAFSDTSDTMQINTLTFHMLKFSSLYSLSLMLTYIWDFFIIIILPIIIINLLHFFKCDYAPSQMYLKQKQSYFNGCNPISKKCMSIH